jgi:uncharacterized damage-inducible protein DinB
MNPMDAVIQELEVETKTTARVLERVPEEQLTWRPHEKSMTLGQLALHVATTPGGVAGMVAGDTLEVDPADFGKQPEAKSRAELMEGLAKSVADAKRYLSGLTAEQAAATWRLMVGGQEALSMPRAVAIRAIMLNHWYHHRGQLSVYLRLLHVAVPSIYGPSADENPMMVKASA